MVMKFVIEQSIIKKLYLRWESLRVSVTCKAVLDRDFIFSVRNINAKEVCR